MTTKTKLGLASGLLAAAMLAACGGGGGSTSHVPSTGSPSGVGAAQPQSGARITFMIPAPPAQKKSSAARVRRSGASRSPAYISYRAKGLQITVTSGSASQTLYYGVPGPIFENDGVANGSGCVVVSAGTSCTYIVPSLGTTETISALEVDQQPNGYSSSTLQGTAFPSNARVLAVGSTSATLTAGALTTVPLSFNPVIASFFDDGCVTNSSSIGVDTRGHRIVTSGASTSPAEYEDNPEVVDAGGYQILPTSSASPQPFVDVNGSAVPFTITASSSHLGLYAETAAQAAGSSPIPSQASFPTSVSIANTSAQYNYDDCGGFLLAVGWDGSPLVAGSTVTYSNNLTATPPSFTGSPVPNVSPTPSTYAFSATYSVVQISAAPATVNLSTDGTSGYPSSATVTASDAGTQNNMYLYPTRATTDYYVVNTGGTIACNTSDGTAIATITVGGMVNGSESFAIAADTGLSAPNYTCSFYLEDHYSGVNTNLVTVNLYQ